MTLLFACSYFVVKWFTTRVGVINVCFKNDLYRDLMTLLLPINEVVVIRNINFNIFHGSWMLKRMFLVLKIMITNKLSWFSIISVIFHDFPIILFICHSFPCYGIFFKLLVKYRIVEFKCWCISLFVDLFLCSQGMQIYIQWKVTMPQLQL